MDVIEDAGGLFRRGLVQEALRVCERRLAANIDDLAALALLAQIHSSTGQHERALPPLQRTTRLKPGDAAALRRLAGCLLALNRVDEATDILRTAIRLEPENTRAHNNLGQAFLRMGKIAEAIGSCREAVRLDPDYAIGHYNLGLALTSSGEFARAAESFEAAITAAPELMEAWVARAAALRRLGRRSEALQTLDAVLRLRADDAEAWSNRGLILHELGRAGEAVAAYRHAIALDPQNVQARSRLLARILPPVAVSENEIDDARFAFETAMTEFESWLCQATLDVSTALLLSQQQFFYLSYQELSNRAALESYRGRCSRALGALELFAGRPRILAVPRPDAASRRRKIGFVSAYVHDHSVFHAILRGWLEHLDHERFELAVFSIGTKRDDLTESAVRFVDRFDMTARPVIDWAHVIRDADLDVLIYPEVGMNEPTLALASLRLAPQQYAAWGHPETSGLPTLDGYLSAALFEPPEAQLHYTERLIRLPNLGVHCLPYAIPDAAADLQSFGLDRRGTWFICPGVPFKYRPQDDRVLVEIARRLEHCTFIFFRHEVAELSHLLERRIAAEFRRAGLDPDAFLRWIPWQPRAEFFRVLRQADVYLDTIGFSGFNTMLQAVECHLPCVTLDGRFMRGRLGGGILRRLGLEDFVSTTKDEYIEAAVRLGSSVTERARMREALRRTASVAYADLDAIRSLEDVLSS